MSKPVGEHEGVEIFFSNQRNQFFFNVKKGRYDLDTYQICINKINYLKRLGEPLKK